MFLAAKVLRLITQFLTTLSSNIILLIIKLYHLVETLIKKSLILITCRVKTRFVLKRCSEDILTCNFFTVININIFFFLIIIIFWKFFKIEKTLSGSLFFFQLFKFLLICYFKKFLFKIAWLTNSSMEFRYVVFMQILLSYRRILP
jgi:hypothetical protein